MRSTTGFDLGIDWLWRLVAVSSLAEKSGLEWRQSRNICRYRAYAWLDCSDYTEESTTLPSPSTSLLFNSFYPLCSVLCSLSTLLTRLRCALCSLYFIFHQTDPADLGSTPLTNAGQAQSHYDQSRFTSSDPSFIYSLAIYYISVRHCFIYSSSYSWSTSNKAPRLNLFPCDKTKCNFLKNILFFFPPFWHLGICISSYWLAIAGWRTIGPNRKRLLQLWTPKHATIPITTVGTLISYSLCSSVFTSFRLHMEINTCLSLHGDWI